MDLQQTFIEHDVCEQSMSQVVKQQVKMLKMAICQVCEQSI